MRRIIRQLEVSTGYSIDGHAETMEPAVALAAILSDETCCYHTAVRNADHSVTLISSDIVCPYCGATRLLKRHNPIMQWHIDTMEKWTEPQFALFPPKEIKNILSFFSTDIPSFSCPHCGRKSYNVNKVTTVTISQSKSKVAICCEITDLSSILCLPYLPQNGFSIEFPFYEQIEFNFRNGHTCVRAMADNDRILHTVDITNKPSILTECELSKCFFRYDAFKQMMVECFQKMTKSEIPMDPNDIDLEDFVFLTRFIGYDKEFYTSIPYDKETLAIDRSFRHVDKLHSCKTAFDYLASFYFAKYKSTRKQVCEKAGLLFYLPECDALYHAVGDINVFRNILDSKYAFDILITLHRHPISLDFLADYCRVKGADGLLRKINSSKCIWVDFRCYMLNYCSLSSYSKSIEQKKWKEKTSSDYINRGMPLNYSLPIIQSTPKGAKCVIDGFSFKPLRNTSECFKVGKELRNCLGGWESFDSVVIAVILANEFVAVLEVWDNSINQARTYENGSIDEIDGLPEAIEKWAKRNGIDCFAEELIEGL